MTSGGMKLGMELAGGGCDKSGSERWLGAGAGAVLLGAGASNISV